MVEQQHEPLSLDVIYDLAKERLDSQLEQIDSIDAKVSIVFGFASLAIGVAAGFLGTKDFEPSATSSSLLFAAISVYSLVIMLALKAYIFRRFEYAPNIKQMLVDALYWEPSVTKLQALSNMVEAMETNKSRIEEKACFGTASLVLLGLEVILVTFALYLV